MGRFSCFFVNLTILWLAGCKHNSQRNIFLVSDWSPDSVQNHSFLISSKIERGIPDFLTLKTKFHGIGSFLSKKNEYEIWYENHRTGNERVRVPSINRIKLDLKYSFSTKCEILSIEFQTGMINKLTEVRNAQNYLITFRID